MKFSHSLQFNCIPEWSNYYISYAALKRIIYQIEKAKLDARFKYPDLISHERSKYDSLSAVEKGFSSPSQVLVTVSEIDQATDQGPKLSLEIIKELENNFSALLKDEIKKCTEFYTRKESEILGKLDKIYLKIKKYEQGMMDQTNRLTSTSADAIDSIFVLLSSDMDQESLSEIGSPRSLSYHNDASSPITLHQQSINVEIFPWIWYQDAQHHDLHIDENIINIWSNIAVVHDRDKLRKALEQLYIRISYLKDYAELNISGFHKILKKYDKMLNEHSQDLWCPLVDQSVLMSRASLLDDAIECLEYLYGKMVMNGKINRAKVYLKQFQRDHIVYERSTIWKDMVEQERHVQGANIIPPKVVVQLDLPADATFWTKIYKYALFYHKFVLFLISLIIFIALLIVPMNRLDTSQQNCLAILVFASLLWALEIFPLFVTSMLLPFLIVVFRVLKDTNTNERLGAIKSADHIFHAMFAPVIFLLLGGFAIAAALSKYHIAKRVTIFIMSKFTGNPITFLLAILILTTISSMWISNVAAPVLCFSVLQPVLRGLPNDSRYIKALIVGVAVAANIGGMTSPISSPQNIYSVDVVMGKILHDKDGNIITSYHASVAPSWWEWLVISLPLSIVSDILCWMFICFICKLKKHDRFEVHTIRASNDPFTTDQWVVVGITLTSIIIWCLDFVLKPYTGSMGVLAIFPLVVFFGLGYLSKDDFNSFLWNVVMMAMGGMALGYAIKSSGLLYWIATKTYDSIEGLSLWTVLFLFSTFVLIITTFISHSIGAMILLPIVQGVGQQMTPPRPQILTFIITLMCSAGMGLPVSGFPNMVAIAQRSPDGKDYINTKDFCIIGIPCSIIVYLSIVSLGYGLMLPLGF